MWDEFDACSFVPVADCSQNFLSSCWRCGGRRVREEGGGEGRRGCREIEKGRRERERERGRERKERERERER